MRRETKASKKRKKPFSFRELIGDDMDKRAAPKQAEAAKTASLAGPGRQGNSPTPTSAPPRQLLKATAVLHHSVPQL